MPHASCSMTCPRFEQVRALGRILWLHQIGEALTAGLGSGVALWPASLARASVRVIAPLYWLHCLCMRWVLALSYGEPPRERGRSSSTSARMGWGWHPVHGAPGHRLL